MIPAAVWAVIEMASAAIAAYETAQAVRDLYENVERYQLGLEQAKQALRETIEALEKEIEHKIEEKEEVVLLRTAAEADPQGPMTRKAQGRGAGEVTINAAIEQKIPFRQVVGLVCDKAAQMPVLDLRRKKGVHIHDLPKAKREILEQLLMKTAEELAEVDLEQFILVRMKQLAANLMFEFVDNCLEWRSPLKCEVSFGPKPGYADHPLASGSGTRLLRKGRINPFYPAPHRSEGCMAADLVITERRKKRCDKNNLFAIIEIKFPGDRIEVDQFNRYKDLLKQAAPIKTEQAPHRFENRVVSSGGRLSLFRYPEDMPAHWHRGKESPRTSRKNKY
jgi:hypothetical protein